MKNSFRALTGPSGSCLSVVGKKVTLLHESPGLLWYGEKNLGMHSVCKLVLQADTTDSGTEPFEDVCRRSLHILDLMDGEPALRLR